MCLHKKFVVRFLLIVSKGFVFLLFPEKTQKLCSQQWNLYLFVLDLYLLMWNNSILLLIYPLSHSILILVLKKNMGLTTSWASNHFNETTTFLKHCKFNTTHCANVLVFIYQLRSCFYISKGPIIINYFNEYLETLCHY